MRYFTCFESDESQINSMAGGSSHAVFPYTPTGTNALRQYYNDFTAFGEWIDAGRANLYFTEASAPIELPVNMNLNYVDLDSAKHLDDKNLNTAIQIMSNYDDDAIINSGDYYDPKGKEWVSDPNAWKMNHNREQLIYILSCIAKTIGPIVTSQTHLADRLAMANQVLVTKPLTWKKMSREKALELIGGNQTSFQKLNGSEVDEPEEEEEEDQFGLGYNSWKEENTKNYIAITEEHRRPDHTIFHENKIHCYTRDYEILVEAKMDQVVSPNRQVMPRDKG